MVHGLARLGSAALTVAEFAIGSDGDPRSRRDCDSHGRPQSQALARRASATSMRHPPGAQLLHDRGLACHRAFLRPVAIDAEPITATGKWQINHLDPKHFSGLMICDRERVVRFIGGEHTALLANGNARSQSKIKFVREFSFSRAFANL